MSNYHALDGNEVGVILKNKFDQAINQSLDLRAFRMYPLLKYKITVELIPYQAAGVDGQGKTITEPDRSDVATFEGHNFIQVVEDAVVLSHESPIIGAESDPQDERINSGLGRMETRKVEGQLADVHVKGSPAPLTGFQAAGPPTAEPVTSAALQPLKSEPAASVHLLDPQLTPEEAEKLDADSWENGTADPAFNAAIAAGEVIPGRVAMANTAATRKGKNPPPVPRSGR